MADFDARRLFVTGSETPILVADDDPNDVTLLEIACAKARLAFPLRVVRNGVEAIEYLGGAGQFGDRRKFPLPSLLLLDLKMPVKSGFDVLSWLRVQPGLKRLFVVVWSSSADPRDIDRAYDLGANSYVVKPSSMGDLHRLVGQLSDWCVGACQLPRLDV
jgi:CheY-like chemotaxis protein